MKVLHISGARSWGGNEQQLADLIPELSQLQVTSLVLGVQGTLLQERSIAAGAAFIPAKKNKLNKYANYKYLKQVVKEHRPDVIHLHTSDAITVFTLSDILFGLKTKAVFSKKGISSTSSFLSRLKYNYKNVAYIICVSGAVKRAFANILKPENHKKMVVVYDGINLQRVAQDNKDAIRQKFNIADGKKVIGNIANHVGAKDLQILIKAIAYLVHELNYKNVHLVQIGKYSKLTPELQEAIAVHKVAEYITLADFQENASGYLRQFDVYAMSSQREGLPLTIYEAFEKKVPVVSTMAGGIPEVITDGVNGYLCPVGDYKQLAKKLKMLLEDNQARELFTERSQRLLHENYTSRHAARQTLKLYKDIKA